MGRSSADGGQRTSTSGAGPLTPTMARAAARAANTGRQSTGSRPPETPDRAGRRTSLSGVGGTRQTGGRESLSGRRPGKADSRDFLLPSEKLPPPMELFSTKERITGMDRVPPAAVAAMDAKFQEHADLDGTICKDPIPDIFRAAGLRVPLEVEVDILEQSDAYASEMDTRFVLADVVLFYSEYTHKECETAPEDLVGQTSAILDEDGDGTIDAEELSAWLKKLHMPISEEFAGRFLDLADTDGSGKVEYDEVRTAPPPGPCPEDAVPRAPSGPRLVPRATHLRFARRRAQLILAMIQNGKVLTTAGMPPRLRRRISSVIQAQTGGGAGD